MPTIRRILEAVRHDWEDFDVRIEDGEGNPLVEGFVDQGEPWRVLEACLDYEPMPGFTVSSFASYDEALKCSQLCGPGETVLT